MLVFAMMSAAAVMIYLQLPRFVMQAQRSKEQLLIDRGEQYQRAIQLYYRKVKSWPQSLDDLEKGNNTRFLRRRYLDPFTGKADWRLVHMANGVYTDSLVYNTKDPKQQQKAQTFVAELPSVGTNGANGQDDEAPNMALRARGSDRTANPLDSLPESLRAFVYPGSVGPRDGTRRPNAEDDVQYANGATAPTSGVYGVGSVDLRGLSGQQILSGNSNGNEAGAGASTPVPGIGGVSFEELQRRAAQQAASGMQPAAPAQPGNSFIGQPPVGEPYVPTATPGAAGLSYTSIAGNDPSNPAVGLPGAPNYPAVPGTVPGSFPTGVNIPPAPAFGPSPAPVASAGGGFIGGPAPAPQVGGFGQGGTGFSAPQPGQMPSFGNPGGGQVPGQFSNNGLAAGGLGATPGVAAPSGAAAQMLNDAIFGPRQPAAGAAGGSVAGGSGLVGVASKYRGEAVKVYREKGRYQLWEFIYDPAKDTSGRKAGIGQSGAPLPGGLPGGGLPGGALQPGGSPAQQNAQPTPGTRVPGTTGIGGGGFSSTSGGFFGPSTGTSSAGAGFIGGAPPPVVPPSGVPAGTGTNGQPLQPGQQPATPAPATPQPATPPAPTGGGGFIGGR